MHRASIGALALALAMPLALLAPTTATQGQGVPNLDTSGNCAERYPGNPGMQAACGRNEAQERRWIENTKVPNDIWRKCRASGGDSYGDLASCMRVAAKTLLSEGGGVASMTTVPFDPAGEAGKAARLAGYRDPGAISLCPPPRRMTARDGCQ